VTRPVIPLALSLWYAFLSLPPSRSLPLAIALYLWLYFVSRPLTQSFATSRPEIVRSNDLVTRPLPSACSVAFASSCFSSTNPELCH
jgi:hypothetical protein